MTLKVKDPIQKLGKNTGSILNATIVAIIERANGLFYKLSIQGHSDKFKIVPAASMHEWSLRKSNNFKTIYDILNSPH